MGVSQLTKNNTKKILLKNNFIFLFKLTNLSNSQKQVKTNIKNGKNRRNKPNVQHPVTLFRAHSNQKRTKEHKNMLIRS